MPSSRHHPVDEFPLLPVLARASDRRQSMDLIRVGADLQVRETFESAAALGEAALERLGTPPDEVAGISARIRERDEQRLQRELVGGLAAGKALFSGKRGQEGESATQQNQ